MCEKEGSGRHRYNQNNPNSATTHGTLFVPRKTQSQKALTMNQGLESQLNKLPKLAHFSLRTQVGSPQVSSMLMAACFGDAA